MTVSKRFYQVAIVFCAVMALMFCLMVPAHATEADPSTNNYYVQVDDHVLKNTANTSTTDVIYGPYKVSAAQIQTATSVAPASQTVYDLMKTVCGASNLTYSTGYLKAIAKSGITTPAATDVTQAKYIAAGYATSATVGALFDSNMISNDGVTTKLGPTEYTGVSGWMFSQNDSSTSSAASYLSVDDTLTTYGDEAVIHFCYSLNGGADVGISTSYIPTIVTESDGVYSYDWSNSVLTVNAGTKHETASQIKAAATVFAQ